jgi:integrase
MERLPDDGWQDALDLYEQQRDDLYQGRTPRDKDGGLTVATLANHFLTFKKARVTTGELTVRSWRDYQKTTDRLVRVFNKGTAVESLRPSDFERLRADISKTRGPVALATEIVRVRVLFNFAFEHDLIDKPIRFGAGFKPPQRKTIRKALNANGSRMLEAGELRKIIDAAPDATMRAMILIAANSGMGNCDVGSLPFSAVDLNIGWVNFPREKTGTPRRFPLWVETLSAIQQAIAERPKPKPGHEQYVFLTRCGMCWCKETNAVPLSREFRRLLDTTGIYRKGLGFYSLRRGFQTIGEEAGETATKYIMGHVDNSMSGRYRQRISDDRLLAVSNYVHEWLFGSK